jgi:adenylate kinase
MDISERILNTIKEIAEKTGKDEDSITWNEIAVEQAEQLNTLFAKRIVSQQRELLIAFQKFIQTQQAIYFLEPEENADNFIKAINCG